MMNDRLHSFLDDYLIAKIAFVIFYAVFAMVLLSGALMPHHILISMILCLLFVGVVLVGRLEYNDHGVRYLYKRAKV